MKKLLGSVVGTLIVATILSFAFCDSASAATPVSSEADFRAQLTVAGNKDLGLVGNMTINQEIPLGDGNTAIDLGGNTLTIGNTIENMFSASGTGVTATIKNGTLDGADKGRLFLATNGVNLTFTDVIFKNGTTQNFEKHLVNGRNEQHYQGGAVYAENGVTVNLNNTQFIENHTKTDTPEKENVGDPTPIPHGGAIYLGGRSTLSIEGGKFLNNWSGSGKVHGEGGAIKAEGGSIININKTGGARTTFEGNHNYKTGAEEGGLQGGAIEATQSLVDIKDTDFIVKGGFDTGGAIKLEHSGTHETHNKITNSSFQLVGKALPTTPIASGYFGTSGGAIISESSFVTIEKGTFTMKDAPKVSFAGGFIDVTGGGEFNLYESSLTGNGYGWNANWQFNSAKYGGALAFENGASAKAHIKDTTFNKFTVDHTGGVISVGHREGATDGLGRTTVNLLMENTTLDGARAYTFDANSAGGGIYVSEGSNVVISGGKIANMDANYGGAIYNKGNVTLLNKALITNNGTTQMAAGIYNDGYLNAHSASFQVNQKTNDGFFAGGMHQYPEVLEAGEQREHSGGTIYARKDVIIGTDAEFSTWTNKQDVRVIDGESSVVLSGKRDKWIYVSIAEKEKTAGAGAYNKRFDEPAHRHVGYVVGRGIEAKDVKTPVLLQDFHVAAPALVQPTAYTPTLDDAKQFHYVSNTVPADQIAGRDDHTSLAQWDYVFNPEHHTVVLGQRAKMVYHSNHKDATLENGITDDAPAGLKLEQIYTIYESTPDGLPKVSIDNKPATDLTILGVKPALKIGNEEYAFLGWYHADLKDKAIHVDTNTTIDDKKYDFAQANFANTWNKPAKSEITEILNWDARNTLHTYAVYGKVLERIKVIKVWENLGQGATAPTVTAVLYKNDEKTAQTLTLSSDKLEDAFTDLPSVDAQGNAIIYTVKEEGDIDGKVTLDGVDYTVSYAVADKTNTMPKTVTITNTKKEVAPPPIPPVPQTMAISVNKVWQGKELDEITVNLLQDGKVTQSVPVHAKISWAYTFGNLLKMDPVDGHTYVYTVTENQIDGYETKVEGDVDAGFVITNTEKEKPTPDTPVPPADNGGDKPNPPKDNDGDKPNPPKDNDGDKPNPPKDNDGDKPNPPKDNDGDKPNPPKDNDGDKPNPPKDNEGDKSNPPTDNGGKKSSTLSTNNKNTQQVHTTSAENTAPKTGDTSPLGLSLAGLFSSLMGFFILFGMRRKEE